MIRRLTAALLAAALCLLAGCSGPAPSSPAPAAPSDPAPEAPGTAYTFTDALGSTVTVDRPQRVVSFYGSFAEMWILAGGELAGTTDDAITERKRPLGEDVAIIGSTRNPNLEMALGDFIAEEDTDELARVCVLGSRVCEEIFGNAATAYNSVLTIDGRDYTVIGVLGSMGTVSSGVSPDTAVYLPYTTAEKYLFGSAIDPTITVLAKDVSDVEQVMADLDITLTDIHPGVTYTITDASGYDANMFAEGPLGSLPTAACDWNSFPEIALPAAEARHFSLPDGEYLFLRNLYETRRMQYTLMNLAGTHPDTSQSGRLRYGSKGTPYVTISLTIPDDLTAHSFWPWRESELSDNFNSCPPGKYFVEAWDVFKNGKFLYTEYKIATAI